MKSSPNQCEPTLAHSCLHPAGTPEIVITLLTENTVMRSLLPTMQCERPEVRNNGLPRSPVFNTVKRFLLKY